MRSRERPCCQAAISFWSTACRYVVVSLNVTSSTHGPSDMIGNVAFPPLQRHGEPSGAYSTACQPSVSAG